MKIITSTGFKIKYGDDNNIRKFDYDFNNPLGVAAGLDKNGDYIDSLASLGFGFIEIGTVTPRPQYGNQKPRLYRDKQSKAIINRILSLKFISKSKKKSLDK